MPFEMLQRLRIKAFSEAKPCVFVQLALSHAASSDLSIGFEASDSAMRPL